MILLGLINHATIAQYHVDAETEMMDVPGKFTDTMQRRTGIFDRPQEPNCCITA
jgi:hypothetical protein